MTIHLSATARTTSSNTSRHRLGRRLSGVLCALVLLTSACSGSSAATADTAAEPSAADNPAEATAEPTEVPEPTATPEPEPTATPAPPTPTPGPDFDGDGTPDDVDVDDDNDDVADVDDAFPMNADRTALLTSLFPVVDRVAQLPDTPAAEALRWVQAQINGDATSIDEVRERFDLSFLAQFSADQIVAFIDGQRATSPVPYDVIEIRVSSEYMIWAQMGNPDVGPGPDPRVLSVGINPSTGLIRQFGIRDSGYGLAHLIYEQDQELSIAEAVEALATKAPTTSVLVAEVTDDGCSAIAGSDETMQRGIGSLFRMWILGALATEVEAGTISPDDVLTLTPGEFIAVGSATTGMLTEPLDLTVQQLANFMLNQDDNGAADVLHDLIGREALDAFVQASGHTSPEALTPLLSVSEFFNLYGNVSTAEASGYLVLDEAGQYEFVESVLEPLGVWTANSQGDPSITQDLTWQASPVDVCNTMSTLRQFNPESEAGRLIDEAFGGEAGLFGLRNEWDRIWFKGGAHFGTEPGSFAVRSFGWMVESNDGRVYAVVGMYNSDTSFPADPIAFELQSLNSQIMMHLTGGTGQ